MNALLLHLCMEVLALNLENNHSYNLNVLLVITEQFVVM